MMYDSSGNGTDDTGPDRAPAQPAAPTPECKCAALGAVVLCDACYRSRQPAAPEPSAERFTSGQISTAKKLFMAADYDRDFHPTLEEAALDDARAWQARAESAEAQLAAVTTDRDSLLRRVHSLSAWLGEPARYVTAKRASEAVFALLTPAPSPGAGEKT